jgi:hypothetical protein
MLKGKEKAARVKKFWCATLGLAPGITHKHYTRLERLAKDKRSSLLQIFLTYGYKKFYNIVPWNLFFKAFSPL